MVPGDLIAEPRALEARTPLEREELARVSAFFAGRPTPEEVMALRPSPAYSARISALLEKNREDGLTKLEDEEWERYERFEHLARMIKLHAWEQLGRPPLDA